MRDLGLTPLKDVSMVRGDYVLRLKKDGYEPFERTISSALARTDPRFDSAAIAVGWTLRKAGTIPPGSVSSREGRTSSLGTASRPRRACPCANT